VISEFLRRNLMRPPDSTNSGTGLTGLSVTTPRDRGARKRDGARGGVPGRGGRASASATRTLTCRSYDRSGQRVRLGGPLRTRRLPPSRSRPPAATADCVAGTSPRRGERFLIPTPEAPPCPRATRGCSRATRVVAGQGRRAGRAALAALLASDSRHRFQARSRRGLQLAGNPASRTARRVHHRRRLSQVRPAHGPIATGARNRGPSEPRGGPISVGMAWECGPIGPSQDECLDG